MSEHTQSQKESILKKMAKLATKLVNILKGNKIISFKGIFSTRKAIMCLSTG